MKVTTTLLGTGTSQGVPPIGCDHPVCLSSNPKDKRLRSAAHFQVGDVSLAVDTGPDFRQQMLRSQIGHIDAILYTHEHRDHTAGFDDIRPFNFMQSSNMQAYALPRVCQQLKHDFAYAFEENKYPGAPGMELHEINGEKAFTVKDVVVQPIPVMHFKLEVLGFRVGNTAYLTDTNAIPESSFALLEGLEVLVLDALRKEEHISHYSLDQAIAVAERIGAKQTYFTHISHFMGFHDEVNAELPSHMQLGYDRLTFTTD